YGLSPTAMVAWIRAFSNEVRARVNRYPTIYTTTGWWNACTGSNATFGGTNPLFVARYSSTVGTLPAGWAAYMIWQYADAGTFPGDQDQFNGTLAQLQAFARGCTPGTVSSSLTPPVGLTFDFTGDGHPDVVARSTDGLLRLYSGLGRVASGYTVIGCGWNGFTAVFSPGDFDGNGHPDIVGRTAAGDLLAYYWDGARFSRTALIGTGWGGVTALFSAGDFTGDGHPDIISRTSTGDLRLYPGTGSGLGSYRRIGIGWSGMTAVFSAGDFNGDGHPDVVGRCADGTLRLYLGNGAGLSRAQVIGTGWGGVTAFDGSRDFDGDGHADLLVRKSTGSFELYRGDGARLNSPSTVLGSGWNPMTSLS
ncbi:MAG: FG-GAP-like repeat-containing protein, partial [Actinobacteria bacterium]|nr:FG-GAP-like repeat-containing protein [Actinomycetota bacterium]